LALRAGHKARSFRLPPEPRVGINFLNGPEGLDHRDPKWQHLSDLGLISGWADQHHPPPIRTKSGLLRTVDGGGRWESVSDQAFSTVQFVDPMIGWAVRSASYRPAPEQVVKTEDGGRTWKGQALAADSICALNKNVIWAAVRGRAASRSPDRTMGGTLGPTTRSRSLRGLSGTARCAFP